MAKVKTRLPRPRSNAYGFQNSSNSSPRSPSIDASWPTVPTPTAPPLEILQSEMETDHPSEAYLSEDEDGSHSTHETQQAASNQAPVSDIVTGVKRSKAWDHFIEYDRIVMSKDEDGNPIKIKKRRDHCKYCPRGVVGDFAIHSQSHGTSGMNRHIKDCKFNPLRQDKNQTVLVGDKSKGNKLTLVSVGDQKEYLDACVEMIIIDELPFSHVEKIGFNRFCRKVCPFFDVPSRRKLCRRFLQVYAREKKILKKELKNYRLSLTTDTWTSVQNVNYMVITAHFIDTEWKMHKRILSFCVIHDHQGSSIGRLIEHCLLNWEIQKVIGMCITLDNVAANKSAMEWLISNMKKSTSFQPLLDGKYLHMRCAAHITNLIVGHGLKRLQKSVLAIRNSIRYVKSLANRLESFKVAIKIENIKHRGLVCLDVPTRWNSTYLMLEAALQFKSAFARMEEFQDRQFLSYFGEPDEEVDEDGNFLPSTKNKGRKVRPPDDDDWEQAEIFVDLLGVFYDVTLRVSASLHPTIHTIFHDICSMETNIEGLLITPQSEVEYTLVDMATNMRAKYLKYFGTFKEVNHMVLIRLVLDARFKLKHVEHTYTELKVDVDEVQRRVRVIKKEIMVLYDEYAPNVDGRDI